MAEWFVEGLNSCPRQMYTALTSLQAQPICVPLKTYTLSTLCGSAVACVEHLQCVLHFRLTFLGHGNLDCTMLEVTLKIASSGDGTHLLHQKMVRE